VKLLTERQTDKLTNAGYYIIALAEASILSTLYTLFVLMRDIAGISRQCCHWTCWRMWSRCRTRSDGAVSAWRWTEEASGTASGAEMPVTTGSSNAAYCVVVWRSRARRSSRRHPHYGVEVSVASISTVL